VAIAHDDPAPQAPEEPEDEYHHRRRRLPLVKTALVLLLVLVVGGAYAGWRYTQTQYYVASDGGQVVIYRGINQSAAGIDLSSVASRSGIPVAGLPAAMAADVRSRRITAWPGPRAS
jgi:protein phosphatase